MKQSFLVKIKEWWFKNSDDPWACFETDGPSRDGIMEFSISWNKSFVDRLQRLGYTGGNDEELVQLFFLSTRVLPENLLNEPAADNAINPEGMPRLTSEMNELRK